MDRNSVGGSSSSVVTSIKQALDIVGGLSEPGKMPCFGYGISPSKCNIGTKLQKIEGSVCSICYACKGMYRFKNTISAHERRYESLKHPLWAKAMAFLVNKRKMTHFRWHDSGDIQGQWHLDNIIEVAKNTPNCAHWLPTKETKLVRDFLVAGNTFPTNLTVRVSSPIINMRPLKGYEHTSTVHSSIATHGFECPAPKNEGKCGSCRQCWDKSVPNVSYASH